MRDESREQFFPNEEIWSLIQHDLREIILDDASRARCMRGLLIGTLPKCCLQSPVS